MAICKAVGNLLPKRMKSTRKNPTEYQAPSPSPNTKRPPIPNPCMASAWWVSQDIAYPESAHTNGTVNKVGPATRCRLTMPHSAINRHVCLSFGGTNTGGSKRWGKDGRDNQEGCLGKTFSTNANVSEISISL